MEKEQFFFTYKHNNLLKKGTMTWKIYNNLKQNGEEIVD